ncbi:alanine racemase [Paenibacillus hodogayensis]|uniref:Alanine racemase n=1 Tax=Paenibacillus hodogayensis TaxID=279208 RepID=A0ABV5VYT3_9BACL
MIKDDFELLTDTPFLALDLEVMERNLRTMAALAKQAGVKLRPHTKTHKSPYIARKQLEYGASGITVAKLGEAEVMADHGIDDILIAFPLVGRNKLKRFDALLDRARLTVGLDDIAVARGINEVGEARKQRIPVYADVDTGLHRMGRDPLASVQSILDIAKLPYLEIRGLMSHTGHAYARPTEEEIRAVAIEDAELMNETRLQLDRLGLHVPEISVGASATARFIGEIPHATEMRPGMYAFNDRFVMAAGGAEERDCAVTVYATVVARPTPERIIIDAGSKTFAADAFKHGGHGHVIGHPNLTLKALSEEHGTIEVAGSSDLQIGDVLRIIPNHICPAINLADELYGFRNGELETIVPVLGRGKNR